MFGIFSFILILFFIVLFFIFAIVGVVLRTLFGWRRKTPSTHHGQQETFRSSESHSSTASGRKKLFDENDGEYVEYEEVE